VVHVEHGIAQYQGLKEIIQDGLAVEFMILDSLRPRGSMSRLPVST